MNYTEMMGDNAQNERQIFNIELNYAADFSIRKPSASLNTTNIKNDAYMDDWMRLMW